MLLNCTAVDEKKRKCNNTEKNQYFFKSYQSSFINSDDFFYQTDSFLCHTKVYFSKQKKNGIDITIESFFLSVYYLTRFFNTIASVLYIQAQDNEEETQLYTHIVYNRLNMVILKT